ncbi:acyl-CoA N-acyltransferase [Microdochium bolleyi]|uniref:Acyl-CoA N-acyltransferase n=1 Tax=Microdochium bolleyi TaxID=196109 RepID=A0A136INP1_9PEZI|nr:acyl-CoA N-acyltransferase [Microdochium bolleyi]
MTAYTIDLATPADAEAVAAVMLSTTEREFSRLQRGTIDPGHNLSRLTSRYRSMLLDDPTQHVIVARAGDETGTVAAAAQWVLKEAEVVPTSEERAALREERKKALDPRLNVAYIMDILQKLGDMEYDVVQGNKHWELENLATLPEHRRQGLAGKLVEWPLAKADADGIPCFLTTDEGGDGERLYAKYGFDRVADVVFDLTKFGGSGQQRHIGMLRKPRSSD